LKRESHTEYALEAKNTMKNPANWRVGLVGYGEVGRILAEDLRAQGVAVSAYDLKLDDPATAAPTAGPCGAAWGAHLMASAVRRWRPSLT
jgi:phosphoglycerate dehydrogenase-like enzyme